MTGGERNVLRIFVVTVALWVGALAAGDPRPVDPLIPAMATIFGGNAGAMLPVSTPPNAIVYGSGYVPMIRMIRTGVVADLATIPLILLATVGIGSMIGLALP
jgi:solute carrier family 13 (sodium-dependent dicarboxylate transporter), member 2/3/5